MLKSFLGRGDEQEASRHCCGVGMSARRLGRPRHIVGRPCQGCRDHWEQVRLCCFDGVGRCAVVLSRGNSFLMEDSLGNFLGMVHLSGTVDARADT